MSLSAIINNYSWLRRFSKLTCFSTLALIFIGGMVKSTNSGLSVPDWPLSYGMVFPPMVGGVFYEHGHRMAASLVGFLTLIQCFWLYKIEKRSWVKNLGLFALLAVIAQGVLGGLTVLFFLPDAISIGHGVLAQTFFIMTIIIAYALSVERAERTKELEHTESLKPILIFIVLVYFQLIIGALMRHTESGLAIPDFPTMGGEWLPLFDQSMLNNINLWRFDHNLDPVTIGQVVVHFIHRVWALLILTTLVFINFVGLNKYKNNKKIFVTMLWLDILVALQILLGIVTVLSEKHPHVTSLHVMTGAAVLGWSVLLILRAGPITLKDFKKATLG